MACLQHINEEYLTQFAKITDLPVISETECVKKGKLVQDTYAVSEEEEDNGAFLAYVLKTGKCTDPTLIMALQILSYVLLESNASPLKNALIDAEICEETEGWFDSSTYEMVFSIVAKNADSDKKELFIKIIEDECKRLIREGLPSDLLQSALRKYDFLLREEDYGSTPKGLIYCTRLMKRWLHGEDPCDSLRMIEIFEKLKNKSKEGYFESLLKNVFIENNDKLTVLFTPEKGKNEREEASFQNKMKDLCKNMSETELTNIKKETDKLEIFQKHIDTPEILAQIPQLEISEIDALPKLTAYRTEKLPNGRPVG